MQQLTRSFSLMFNYLSRLNRIMLGSLAIFTLIIAIWKNSIYFPLFGRLNTTIVSPEKRKFIDQPIDTTGHSSQFSKENEKDIEKNNSNIKIHETSNTNKYVIFSGDTISKILSQHNVPIADIKVLSREHADLQNIKVGQSLSWKMTVNGNLQYLIWNVSQREIRTYNRIYGKFQENITYIKGKWCNTTLTGYLNGTFINSAQTAGLSYSDTYAVISALQWQIDFKKLHKGDKFSVLIAREMLNGKSARTQLLAVYLHTAGKDYYAFLADNGKFYNRDAKGVTQSFMRLPTLKQFRISSTFNPKRLNPITGRITTHLGVDFAVPVGTPILAVSDGEVIISKYDDIAGNYIAIRHGHQYMTRYMHLHKLLVKPGQKVKLGERIALSGNTGRSTGPHLHYEVWLNQRPINPLTATLPRNESLTGHDRSEYLNKIKTIIPQLHS
ncbi:metalloendopeptidase-like membrane protein [secondary endosymbiont of Heteropsylla cubana]|uniref:Metalloendopeptidase-like membrane protein n=1 Tax=secondary endosymbiont of Heteropsylla cubana TaxID=134287 RepID=J3TYF5_9ENTR|nr:murein DD-endopeptidase MepM [secondary endosymbiont of Heteropsylla cubana]AFP85380.1 metalloendopeptidase-like membrane protein [secondary endosymbiont of Heteropsylla cubana]